MKKLRRRLALLLLIAVCAVCLFGCSLPNSNANSTVAVDEEGKVTETIIESFDGADYTEEELKEYIELQIAQYGAGDVVLDSCDIGGESVKVVMTYPSVDVYADFNGVTCFLGTIQEAEDAGYKVDQTYLDPSGVVGDKDTIEQRKKEWKVFIVSEAIYVRVPDKILYATENVTITGRMTAHIESVMQNADEESGLNPYATVADQYAYIIYK